MTNRDQHPNPDPIVTGRQPVLDRRPPSRGPWLWLVIVACVLIAAAVIYGTTANRQEAATPAVIATPAAVPSTPAPRPQTTTGQTPAPATGQQAPAR